MDLFRTHKGITGLETAIVLIAFVVVAAVFAFTVLTTGLFTSEKAKETTMAGISSQASLALASGVIAGGNNLGDDCRGVVPVAPNPPVETTGQFTDLVECDIHWAGWNADPPTVHVQTMQVRIAPALGVENVPFDPNQLLVTYMDSETAHLLPFIPARGTANPALPVDAAIRWSNPEEGTDWQSCRNGGAGGNNTTSFFCIRWSQGSDQDFVLEQGETVDIIMIGKEGPLHDRLMPGRIFQIEVIPQQGGILTFKRTLPDVFRWVMNLG